MLFEEPRRFLEVLLGVRLPRVGGALRVRLSLEHDEVGRDAGVAHLAMHPHGVAQEEVARTGGQQRRQKARGRRRPARAAGL
jgi:hypothetical protein